MRSVREKRSFWRQLSAFEVLAIAFLLAWIIDGIRYEWVVPWPLVLTAPWALYLLIRARQLGGPDALRHRTINQEIDRLRHPEQPITWRRIARRPITYTSGYKPLREFHLQEVIDAREEAQRSTAPESAEVDA